jgi:O-antigen/teichoic acid export membrane protein
MAGDLDGVRAQPQRRERAVAAARAQLERALADGAHGHTGGAGTVGERAVGTDDRGGAVESDRQVQEDALGAAEVARVADEDGVQRGRPGQAAKVTRRGTISAMTDERLAFPRDELRRRTVRGAIVNAFFLGGGEALVLLQGLIVIALLDPSDIGLYGIVTTTAMTIVQLRRVGIDEAFVRQEEADQEEEFQRAFTIELAIGLAFSLALLVLAPIVAVAYGDDRLLPLMIAVAYLPAGFALQAPTWIFFRRMDFVRVRALQVLIPVATFCVTVPLAAATHSVWALVIGPAVGNTVAIAAGVLVSPYRLRLRMPDRATRRRYLGFSWPIFVAAGALLVVQQGQVFAFDLDGGLAAAGYITVAWTLTRYADRADQIIATTIYPAIVIVKDQPGTLREIFVKSNRIALIWVLPFCAGQILFAPDLVHFVLGDKWQPAVVLIQGLAGAAAIQQLGYNWFSFYRARGEPRSQAVESAAMVATFLGLAVPALFLWGFEGFVWGRIASAVLVVLVRRVYVRRLLPDVALLGLGARAAAPVLAACGLVLVLRVAIGDGRPVGQAIAELLVFLVATGAFTWLAERRLLREVIAQARSGGGLGAAVAGGTAP